MIVRRAQEQEFQEWLNAAPQPRGQLVAHKRLEAQHARRFSIVRVELLEERAQLKKPVSSVLQISCSADVGTQCQL